MENPEYIPTKVRMNTVCSEPPCVIENKEVCGNHAAFRQDNETLLGSKKEVVVVENNFGDIILDLGEERENQIRSGYDVAHDRAHTDEELNTRMQKYYLQAFKAKADGNLDLAREKFVKAGAMNIALIQVVDSLR